MQINYFDHELGGKRLRIIDGLLDKAHLARLDQALRGASYRRLEIATPESDHITHHSLELSLGDAKNLQLLEFSQQHVEQFSRHSQLKIHRIYCNACYFGDLLLPHRDAEPGSGDITALWYLNAEWDRNWGGETLFYDESNETALAVEPKAGRLVMFDGELLHVGKAPNRQCHQPRFTLAFKFYP